MKRWIIENWLILCVGAILTIIFTRVAFAERGYFAVGGEWLTIPILLGIDRALKYYKASRNK